MTRPRSAIVAELTEARARVFELEAELALLDPAPATLDKRGSSGFPLPQAGRGFERALDRAAAAELEFRMSELSEDWACAAWFKGTEFDLWSALQGDRNDWEISPIDIEQLSDLSAKCGGWFHWLSAYTAQIEAGPLFIPLDEWLPLYAVYRAADLPRAFDRRAVAPLT